MCLAVTCHLHCWQNDRDLLRATAVTRGWNGYPNKSQNRKSTLEKKILPPFLRGFEPASFQSRIRRSNRWTIPEWVTVSLYSGFLNIHWSCVLTALFGRCMAGAMWNCSRLGARSVYTVQPCTSLVCHFIRSHACRVLVCLAVTCTFGRMTGIVYVLLL